jgi:hypothetical protein
MSGSGRRILTTNPRPGAAGAEEVVQHAIPLGTDLYRGVAIVRADRAARTQAIVARIVESFAPAASSNSR